MELTIYIRIIQSQQLQMSNPSVNPGSVETQQMRVVAPVGVRPLFWLVFEVSFNSVE